eukprot:scaffold107762_cov36-Cyclotella_meneghiniana.AAC.1
MPSQAAHNHHTSSVSDNNTTTSNIPSAVPLQTSAAATGKLVDWQKAKLAKRREYLKRKAKQQQKSQHCKKQTKKKTSLFRQLRTQNDEPTILHDPAVHHHSATPLLPPFTVQQQQMIIHPCPTIQFQSNNDNTMNLMLPFNNTNDNDSYNTEQQASNVAMKKQVKVSNKQKIESESKTNSTANNWNELLQGLFDDTTHEHYSVTNYWGDPCQEEVTMSQCNTNYSDSISTITTEASGEAEFLKKTWAALAPVLDLNTIQRNYDSVNNIARRGMDGNVIIDQTSCTVAASNTTKGDYSGNNKTRITPHGTAGECTAAYYQEKSINSTFQTDHGTTNKTNYSSSKKARRLFRSLPICQPRNLDLKKLLTEDQYCCNKEDSDDSVNDAVNATSIGGHNVKTINSAAK